MNSRFTNATWITALLIGSVPLPSVADRHCAPALDYYYFGRSALSRAGGTCDETLQASLSNLVEASIQAQVCGCSSLRLMLTDFIRKLESAEMTCEERQAEILDLDLEISEQIEACH
jgi:hypothetical protein